MRRERVELLVSRGCLMELIYKSFSPIFTENRGRVVELA